MFFKKTNKPDNGDGEGDGESKPEGVKRDRRKAASFFRHAETVADARNHDYAIELYINGLRHDPDNMDKHEALHEVALRRKVAGGKPPGLTERLTFGSKDKIEKFLHAESLWAKDPLSLVRMLTVMERATEADANEEEYNIGEVAHWIGVMILEKQQTDRPPTKDQYLKLRDLFSTIGAADKALEACRRAMEMAPDDENLSTEYRDLEAEVAMQKGHYGEQKPEDVDFQKSVRNMDEQRALDQESQLSKTDRAIDEIIERRRQEFEQDPDDLAAREKLVRALLDRHSDETENKAVQLLQEVYEKDNNYRHKVAIGNIRMRQAERKLKSLFDAFQKSKAEEDRTKYKEFYRQKVKYELHEFQERIKQYPTDMRWRFELGRRLVAIKQFDLAIEHLQKAVADPKFRVLAYNLLGQSYLAKEWHEEAVGAFQKALEFHKNPDDRTGLEIRYFLMETLYKAAAESKNADRAREALRVGSEILQIDINYRDIKTRIDSLRQLVKDLQG